MEKLYIPTSTLNFNNILATESISPESFYLNRDFGYKRFSKVEPNPFSNCLIAYNKLPVFKIKESDFDDYPMIIEISSELINKKTIGNTIEKNGIKIFQISKTIYLHPSKAKFIFFNEKEKSIALIKAEPSIETKLIPVYRNRFEIIKNDYNIFEWDKTFLENIKDLFSDKIEESVRYDLMINKLKGFYYSYFLGIILSLSKKEESIKKDIFSISQSLSSLSNQQNIYSDGSIEELNRTVKRLQEISLNIKKGSKYKDVKNISQIAEINFNALKITQLTDSFFEVNEAEIYRSIINEILEYPISDIQTFQVEKINLAFRIGAILKDYYSNWEQSEEREYLNSLMDNIESYKPFDLKSHSSILLQSVALFILKGESPDKLIENLSKNQIIDYRIALGLWGSIFGFSALPKTLTDILFRAENIQITRLLYQDVQTKLHNVKSEEKIIIDNEKPIKPEIIKAPPSHPKPLPDSNISPVEKDILDKIKECCNLNENQIESIIQIYEQNKGLINKKFFIEIKKIRGIGPKTIEKIKKALNYNDKIEVKNNPSLFQNYNVKDIKFYEDKFAYDFLEKLIPVNLSKKFKTDLLWFQEEFLKGIDSKYYRKAKNDNKSVIEYFKRYIEKKKYANEIDINSIIDKLKEKYLPN